MNVEYKIGSHFPHPNPNPGQENSRILLTEDYFDFHCYLMEPNELEVETWRTGKIRYGMYHYWDAPIFILDFPEANMLFDANISMYSLRSKQARKGWLSSNSNTVNLFLIDLKSHLLYSTRVISLRPEFVKYLHRYLKAETNIYSSMEEVENIITEASQTVTTQQMMNWIDMFDL